MPRVAVLGASSSPVVGIEYERHPEWSALAALPAYDIVLLDLPAVRAGEALRSLRLTSSPTLALRVTGGGFPLLGDSCSRSTGFLLHRAA